MIYLGVILGLALLAAPISGTIAEGDEEGQNPRTRSGNLFANSFRTYTDCGGVVPISPLFPTTLNYKSNEEFSPTEWCIWTLVPDDGVRSISLRVQQNMTDDPFDGLTAYFWENGTLSSWKTPAAGGSKTIQTSVIYLKFNSDFIYQSNGPSIYVSASGSPGPKTSKAYHVEKDLGYFRYVQTPGFSYTQASLVVQGNSTGVLSDNLRVILSSTLGPEDTIQIYSLFDHRESLTHALLTRVSGTKITDLVTSTFYPFLLVLDVRSDVAEKIFSLEWSNYIHKNV